MTSISKLCLLAWLFAAPAVAAEGPKYHVVGLVAEGLARTDRDWLEGYLGVAYPSDLTGADADRLQKKLMTTAVFSDAKVTFEPVPKEPGTYYLFVHVDEKWTTIPVVRGVYGGGTPLRVVGGYDINSFGHLVTLGGEARQYGDAPPGYVLYFRNPRADGDRYYLGAELWREFRRRDLWDDKGKVRGHVDTNMGMVRLRYLGGGRPWKYGSDVELIQEAPSRFRTEPGADPVPPSNLVFNTGQRRQLKVLPTVLFDDVELSNLNYDGYRAKLKAGPIFVTGGERTQGAAELESYAYKLLPEELNLAARAVVGATTLNSFQGNYFLGGLDTIRGIPDGALYGTHAAYVNLEARQIVLKAKYLWVQPAVFADAGAAGLDWSDTFAHQRSTAGVGVRLAVPQVYRMILRIDYGWSLSGPRTKGITAGLNQFFDPYIPL